MKILSENLVNFKKIAPKKVERKTWNEKSLNFRIAERIVKDEETRVKKTVVKTC